MLKTILRLFSHRKADTQLDRELRFHLDQQTADYITQGMEEKEAYRRASISLGGIEQVRQRCRDRRWENGFEGIGRDLRYALRRLAKAPHFSATCIIALALGIGSTITVFSLVYGLLFQPFPSLNFKHCAVFRIRNDSQTGNNERNIFSVSEFLTFEEQTHVFEDIVGYDNTVNVSYNDGAGTREVFEETGVESHAGAGGAYVTTNTFEFFGAKPLLGRGFSKADGSTGAPPVFVMNYRLWRRMFHGNPDIVGKTFSLNGEPRTLIGIMSADVQLYGAGVWFPAALGDNSGHSALGLNIIGRLKSAVARKTADAELTLIAHRLAKSDPAAYPARFSVVTESLTDSLIRNFKTTLYVLAVAVCMLLMIACTNVAILLLSRGTTREREIALRVSLGASHTRLVRQFLAEGFALAISGCTLGCLLAFFEIKWLLVLIPAHRIPDGATVQLDVPAILFVVTIGLITTLFFGTIPAVSAVRNNFRNVLNIGKGTLRPQSGLSRNILVIAQVSLSIILLSSAGLMMRSFLALTHIELGFRPGSVLYARLNLPQHSYETKERRKPLVENLLNRIRTLPGVVSAAETWSLPPEDWKSSEIAVFGKPRAQAWKANVNLCSTEYVQTLGISLQRGRLLTQDDVESARHVAVINQAFSNQFFGTADPIGEKVAFDAIDQLHDTPHGAFFEIIGVVSNYVNSGLKSSPAPEALLPYTISSFGVPNVLVRLQEQSPALLKNVDQAIWAVDPSIAIDMSGSLESLLDQYEYQEPRFEFGLSMGFAGIGLLLVLVGIYSVMAYTVAVQTHEIGIRTALGADSAAIAWMVLRRGLTLISVGATIGVLTSLGLTRLLSSQVWGISVADPWTFAGVISSIVITGTCACALPARRAAKVDPLIALRSE